MTTAMIIAAALMWVLIGMLMVKVYQQDKELADLKSRFTRLCLNGGQAELGYGEVRPIPGERSMRIIMQGGGGGGSGRPLMVSSYGSGGSSAASESRAIGGRGGDGWRPKDGPLIDWYNGLDSVDKAWVDGENLGQPGTVFIDSQGRKSARGGKGGRSFEDIHQEWMQRQKK